MHLTTIDYTVMVAYAAALIIMGIVLLKTASGGLEEYFLGGRKLPWYLLGSSGMASWFDVTGTMLITSFLFLIGPRGLFIEFRGGAVLVLIFLLCFTGKWHRRSGCITGAEWMVFRFGNGKDAVAARLITAIVSVLLVIGMIAYLVRGTGLFLAMFMPYSPNECAAGLLVVAVIYTMFSGFYGVVISDVLQGLLVLVAALALGVTAFNLIPSADAVAVVAERVTGNPNWTASAPTWRAQMPDVPEYDVFRYLTLAAGFYLIKEFIGGFGSGADPKYFAARSDKEAGYLSLFVSVLIMIRWPMMLGLAVLGLFLVDKAYPDPTIVHGVADLIHHFHPEVVKADWHEVTSTIVAYPETHDPAMIAGLVERLGDDWMTKLPLVSFDGIVDPERILPAVILGWVPMGFRGLVLVTIMAASMSTFDSTLNSACGFVVRDLYQGQLRKLAGNRELMFVSYVTTVLLAIVGFWFGINVGSINEVWDWIVVSLTTGLLIPGLLRLYWWRMNGWGVAAGLVAGGVAAVLQRIFFPGLEPWFKYLMVAPIGLIATVGGCLLTQPIDRDRLIEFYKTTRPFGLWGPAREVLTEEQLAYIDRENRFDLISLPFAFVYLVTLFVIPMQLVIHRFDALWYSIPIFAVSLVGLYFFWFKKLGPDRDMQLEPDLRGEPRPLLDETPEPTPASVH